MKITAACRIALVLAGMLFGTATQARTNLGRIMRPGDPADCKNTPVKTWPGHWLALKQEGNTWFIAPTEVSIVNGNYHSSKPADYLFDIGKPETPGSVRSSSISRHGDDFLFEFDGVDYRWIQAASSHYYLTDGKSYWNGEWLKMPEATSPAAPKSKEAHRCGYGAGCHELLWAGDINHDGNLDLIVWFNEGEDEGLQLWLGKQGDGGLYFQTAARGLYQYNMSFACAFRNNGERHQ